MSLPVPSPETSSPIHLLSRHEFTRIRSRDMFGIEQVWVDARTQVPMFDKERALQDAIGQLRGFGAGGLGEQVLAERSGEIDREKLVRYGEDGTPAGAGPAPVGLRQGRPLHSSIPGLKTVAMRPFGVRVAAVVRATGAPHDLVLRDYALSHMLAATDIL